MERKEVPPALLHRWWSRLAVIGCALHASPGHALDHHSLVVETGSPDALCPELTETRQAVARRLGALELGGRGSWKARYTIGHAPEGSPRDFVRLELFDSDGVLRLTRDLPLEGERCGTMAEVIALVLDRYFRSLDQQSASQARNPPTVVAKTLPQEPETKPSPPSPQARHTTKAATRTAGPSAASRWVATTVEIAAALGSARPVAGVRAVARVAQSFTMGGALLLGLGRETETVRAGRVYTYSSSVRGYAGWGFGHGRLTGFVGPEIELTVERSGAEGYALNRNPYRALWSAGLTTGMLLHPSEQLVVGVWTALDANIPGLSGRLYVDRQEVLRPTVLEPWLGVGVGYAFSL